MFIDEMSYNKVKEIYSLHLSEIGGIKFTNREIDVVACVLHNRGEKKIASLLSISPRTVGTHTHNIMLKLSCSSKENLIDFVERSGKLLFFKQYYLNLLVNRYYIAELLKISSYNKDGVEINVVYGDIDENSTQLLQNIKEDLQKVNILFSSQKEDKDIGKNIVEITIKDSNDLISLSLDTDKKNKSKKSQLIDFRGGRNFYDSIFSLINLILKNPVVEDGRKEFHKNSQALEEPLIETGKKVDTVSKKNNNSNITFFKRRNTYLLAALILVFLVVTKPFMKFQINNSDSVRAQLLVPHSGIILERPNIMKVLYKTLSGKDPINTVAIVGIGGSGKTTIARMYARMQKIPVIWEINSESHETIIFSFGQLAYSLSDAQGKKELAVIQNLENKKEREDRLLLFLTRILKSYKDWIILYNDVVSFKDIKRYLPQDPQVWGRGKVIITTRDSNIDHNNYIPASNIIKLGELNQDEKLKLFSNIVGTDIKKPDTIVSRKKFLTNLPPYPLDISLAAYYIREEKTSYSDYLLHLKTQDDEFSSMQQSILGDVGEYTDTRCNIVNLSAKHIINSSKDNKSLLLMISALDPKNIPKKFLNDYKGEVAVSKFMHDLKKFSVIEEKYENDEVGTIISIHKSIQDLLMAYMIRFFKLSDNTKFLDGIYNVIETHLKTELSKNVDPRIPMIFSNANTLLKHEKYMSKTVVSKLSYNLASYYFDMTNYPDSIIMFNKSLQITEDIYGKDSIEASKIAVRLGKAYRNSGKYFAAQTLLTKAYEFYKGYYGEDHLETNLTAFNLGTVYRNVGEFDKSITILKKALSVFENKLGKNHIKTATASMHIGNAYANIGNYMQAKKYLMYDAEIYISNYGKDNVKTAWALTRLSCIYRYLGDNLRAKELIHQAKEIYEKLAGKTSTETAWTMVKLGSVYNELGEYKRAKSLIEDALKIYRKYLPDDHVILAWSKLKLAFTLQNLRDYKNSISLIEDSVRIYQSYYGPNHIYTAKALRDLGLTYYAKGSLDKSAYFLEKIVPMLSKVRHHSYYKCLRSLSDIYMRKAQLANTQDERMKLQKEASEYLKSSAQLINKDL